MRVTLKKVALWLAVLALPWLHAAEEELCKVNGERLPGPVTFANGTWSAGAVKVPAMDVLLAQFTEYPPPERIPAGVFMRGGSLVVGALDSVIGDKLTVNARSLGAALEIKREELAGAFFGLPTGARENFPALGRYGALIAALAGGIDDAKPSDAFGGTQIFPGRRDRVTYANLDGLDGKLMRLGSEKAIVEMPGGKMSTPGREVIRLIECKNEPAPPLKDDGRSGPEVIVRLKAGDVLRGRLTKLDDKALVLTTAFAGALTLPREILAVVFPSGTHGSGVQWLSQLKPAEAKHTPFFDAEFPLRVNLSAEGRMIRLNGMICDRGLGVHSKSELAWRFEPAAGRKFVAFVGIDDETGGRGLAEARVLVDGKQVFASGPLKGGEAPKSVAVDLANAKELKLVVDYGSDQDDSADHVSWGWAAVVK